MDIIQVVDAVLPAVRYGGTERVVWALARELVRAGHRVTFLARAGSVCDFAEVVVRDDRPLAEQIAAIGGDIVHFHEGRGIFTDEERAAMKLPSVTTIHGNVSGEIGENAIFVSRNHAERHGARTYVYNGLDWDEYAAPDLGGFSGRRYFHFLAKAAWRVKNVQGAIDVVRGLPGGQLRVLGGTRLNFKMGFRFTITPPPLCPVFRDGGSTAEELPPARLPWLDFPREMARAFRPCRNRKPVVWDACLLYPLRVVAGAGRA